MDCLKYHKMLLYEPQNGRSQPAKKQYASIRLSIHPSIFFQCLTLHPLSQVHVLGMIIQYLNWPLVFWRRPLRSCRGEGSDSPEGWSAACETHPASPSPADSSGCRRQTAEHPRDAKGEEESVRD